VATTTVSAPTTHVIQITQPSSAQPVTPLRQPVQQVVVPQVVATTAAPIVIPVAAPANAPAKKGLSLTVILHFPNFLLQKIHFSYFCELI